jgi:hypothetical protein
MKNILNYSFLLFSIALLVGCNGNPTSSDLSGAIAATNNRGMGKALKFKSIASFENGISNLSPDKLADLENKNISMVVFYDAEAEWANTFNSGNYKKTGDEQFNSLLAQYKLSITEQSDFDDLTEMLVLEADEKLNQPAAAAKEISKIKGVLMVHLKADKNETTETANNN